MHSLIQKEAVIGTLNLKTSVVDRFSGIFLMFSRCTDICLKYFKYINTIFQVSFFLKTCLSQPVEEVLWSLFCRTRVMNLKMNKSHSPHPCLGSADTSSAFSFCSRLAFAFLPVCDGFNCLSLILLISSGSLSLCATTNRSYFSLSSACWCSFKYFLSRSGSFCLLLGVPSVHCQDV